VLKPQQRRPGAGRTRRALALVALAGLLMVLATPVSSVEARGSAKRAPAPCGGEKLPKKPGGGKWVCTFDDEFTGPKLNRAKWMVDRTAFNSQRVGTACLMDDKRVVSQAKGALTLSVIDTGKSFRCDAPSLPFRTRLISGSVNTYKKFSQRYGRFEIRARFPATTTPGLLSSLWLYPVVKSTNWNKAGNTGEIDIAEHYSQWADRSIPYAHYLPLDRSETRTSTTCMVAHPENFHVYTLVWTATKIVVTYDGAPCLTVANWTPMPPSKAPAPFNTADLISLTSGVGVRGNAPRASTPFPARTQIDYVRVWR